MICARGSSGSGKNLLWARTDILLVTRTMWVYVHADWPSASRATHFGPMTGPRLCRQVVSSNETFEEIGTAVRRVWYSTY